MHSVGTSSYNADDVGKALCSPTWYCLPNLRRGREAASTQEAPRHEKQGKPTSKGR